MDHKLKCTDNYGRDRGIVSAPSFKDALLVKSMKSITLTCVRQYC